MIEKLRQLKKKSQMTNQQIAEKSNIPESTIARIFSGKTPNPTVATVIAMARAMGGSPADLLNEEDKIRTEENPAPAEGGEVLSAPEDKAPAAPDSGENDHAVPDLRTLEYAASHERFYEDIISLYKLEIKKKDAWISRLFWCLAAVVLFILVVLIFDITHPGFGFVKY